MAFLVLLRNDFGDVVTWSLGPMRMMLLSHPEHIAELLAGDEKLYQPVDASWVFKQLVGDSVIRSQGADWRRKRSLVQPSVRPRQVRGHAATMVHGALTAAESWQDGQRIDVQREMSLLTERIVVQSLFGNDLGGRDRKLGDAMAVVGRELGAELRGIGLLTPSWVRTPARRRVLAAVATVDGEIDRLIRARQDAGREADDRENVLARLLAARDEDGGRLTMRQVRDEAVTLWGAGHETTSTALTWCWYLLSASPDARARLTTELDRILAGRAPSYDDYGRLTWTRQVIKEALRLYPPAWVLPPRTARENVTLGGTPIPAGTTIWCSPWSTQRDPRWFPHPDAFRPERWDMERPDGVPEHAWFPFGGGPRACLGARFALVEMTLVLATLAQRFHLDVHAETVTPKAGLQLQPAAPLHATLHERCGPSAMNYRPLPPGATGATSH